MRLHRGFPLRSNFFLPGACGVTVKSVQGMDEFEMRARLYRPVRHMRALFCTRGSGSKVVMAG